MDRDIFNQAYHPGKVLWRGHKSAQAGRGPNAELRRQRSSEPLQQVLVSDFRIK